MRSWTIERPSWSWGAQAVYLQTADLALSVAPFTTDADLALDPSQLAEEPDLHAVVEGADFRLEPSFPHHTKNPGQWWTSIHIGSTEAEASVDLLVPHGAAPSGGRRSARLTGHAKLVARKVSGLEAALWDHDLFEVGALEERDPRRIQAKVAGPAALLVAKAHKLADRVQDGRSDRLSAKDASDVYRLVVATPRHALVAKLERLLQVPETATATADAIDHLQRLFGRSRSQGIALAIDALAGAVDGRQASAVLVAAVRDLPASR